MRKKIINCQLSIVNCLLIFLLWSTAGAQAQVNIGSMDNPHGGAVLDLSKVSGKNLGLLLPQVSLKTDVSTWNLDGTGDGATGMVIFNTNPDISGGKGRGLYVWDGDSWNAMKPLNLTNATPATAFAISPTTIDINVGSFQFVNVLSDSWVPDETTYKGVTWSVVNGAAKVAITAQDFYGCTVTGLAEGVAVVRATSIDDNSYRDCTVTVVTCSGPATPGAISFDKTTVCAGETFTASVEAVAGADSYRWNVTGNGLSVPVNSTDRSIEIRANTAGSISLGGISVSAVNGCSSSSPISATGYLTVTDKPAQPGEIIFDTNESCVNGTFTARVEPVEGATSYTWNVSGTGLSKLEESTENEITIQTTVEGANISRSGISVTANNACGSSAATPGTGTVSVGIVPGQPGAIRFSPDATCADGSFTAIIDPVPGAAFYTWTITGDGFSAASPSISNSIVINTTAAGTISRTGISVTAGSLCGNSSSVSGEGSVTVTAVPTQPGGITFPATVCRNVNFTASIPEVSGATSYTWTVSGEGLSKVSSADNTVTIRATVSGEISLAGVSVYYTVPSCGNSPERTGAGQSISVTDVPDAPTGITFSKTANIKLNEEFTATATPEVNTGLKIPATYAWTLPAGLSNVGTPTTARTVTLKGTTAGTYTGGIKVKAQNGCGDGGEYTNATSVTVLPCSDVPTQPGAMTIPTTVVVNSDFAASVPAVSSGTLIPTTYTWSVPEGLTIKDGHGTRSITITAGSEATTHAIGSITVTAANDCGEQETYRGNASPVIVTTCPGYVCVDCAYDYSEAQGGGSGAGALGQTPSSTSTDETWSPNTGLGTLAWTANDTDLEAAFTATGGALCVYKSDSNSGSTATWPAAVSACTNGEFDGGDTDWYLPNLRELRAMYDSFTGTAGSSKVGPANPPSGWTNLRSNNYWSSTERGASYGLYFRFDNGYRYYDGKTPNRSVRCVRRL